MSLGHRRESQGLPPENDRSFSTLRHDPKGMASNNQPYLLYMVMIGQHWGACFFWMSLRLLVPSPSPSPLFHSSFLPFFLSSEVQEAFSLAFRFYFFPFYFLEIYFYFLAFFILSDLPFHINTQGLFWRQDSSARWRTGWGVLDVLLVEKVELSTTRPLPPPPPRETIYSFDRLAWQAGKIPTVLGIRLCLKRTYRLTIPSLPKSPCLTTSRSSLFLFTSPLPNPK